MFDLTKIDEFFPCEKFREGQKEIIEKILKAFDSGKKVVILEAPTGSGKSPIGIAIAKFFASSYYITIQKTLQDQITADFGENSKETEPVIDLKGRINYQCTYYPAMIKVFNERIALFGKEKKTTEKLERLLKIEKTNPMANVGECIRIGKSKLAECEGDVCVCPYLQRKQEAQMAKVCLLNFSSFFYQWMFGGFSKRNLLIVDEAHNCGQQILNFVSIKISDISFMKFGIKFPEYSNVIDYLDYFNEIDILKLIDEVIDDFDREGEAHQVDEWKSRREKIFNLMAIVEKEDPDERWIVEFQESDRQMIRTIEFKPIFSRDFAERLLLSAGDKILLMSATILNPNVLCETLGLEKSEVYSCRMKNRFPIKNRRIFYTPKGSLSFKNKMQSYPNIAKGVDEICSKYVGKKGIVHTNNFEICRKLLDLCKKETTKRFLFQKDWDNKEEMLEFHKKQKDTVIIAPAMHEGIDLKEDLSRFQIIVKVPYPSRRDKQIVRRSEVDKDYYDWLTALKISQAYGRSVRSETDWADTYILDSDFEWFRKKAKRFLPEWFLEAIQT